MIRLLIGRAGSGKTTLCLEQIVKELHRGKDGPALIYLVPEQAAFQAEYALATLPGLGGSIRAQVLSFRRLAWRVLQETGGGRRLFIDDTGKGMVLRKVLERQKASLKIFRHAGEKPGMVNELVRLYNEFRRAGISVFQLKEYYSRQKQDSGKGGLLGEKLLEVALVLEEAEKELCTHYVDTEDYLLMLALKISSSSFVRGALFWVDGFYSFTQLELFVLESLCRYAGGMTITLCLERDYTPEETVDELAPFYTTALTCRQLQRLAAACGVSMEKIILSQGDRVESLRFRDNPPLAHLESHLHRYPAVAYPPDKKPLPLRLVAASGRRSEVEAVAREIITLVRDENYRFRELAVVAHNLEQYGDLIAPVFRDYGIPFFLDQKRTILHHPLVEFIRSALEVVNGNWRPDAVFRCIKSGFLFPVTAETEQRKLWRDRAARLENYVLAFGIKGARWRQEEIWHFTYRDTLEEEENKGPSHVETIFLEQIDKIRRCLSEPLLRFQENFRASTLVKDRVKALYTLLQDVSAAKHLQLAAEQAREEGETEKSREQEQVYQGIINLMDQLVEILGEEEISATLFVRLIDAGLSTLRLSLVPPSLDQVLVGNLERTRTGEVKVLFLLGVNDGVLPSRPGGEAIFTERERETLEALGFPLSPGPRRRLLDEEFLIYLALTRACDRLWVSYALADEEGKALLPSLLVTRLQELFPGLVEELSPAQPQGVAYPAHAAAADEVEDKDDLDAASVLPFVFHPRQTLSHLAVQLGCWKRGEFLNPLWWEVYNWYARGNVEKETVRRLLAGLFYRNMETPLTLQTSRELYGPRLQTSASRLERFRFCPFAHFAAYGLHLQERTQYRLEAPDTGRFFHVALRNVACTLQEQGKHWSESGRKELLHLVSKEVAKLLPRLQREILLSSHRYKYLAKKIEETVGRAVLSLAEQDRRSAFKPYAVEIAFGNEGEIPPLCLALPDGSTMEVVGRIDRLDVARTAEGRIYLRVIDYKSGAVDLNLVEILHGLSLQLLLYLDAVLSHSREWLNAEAMPAGIFYFRVHDPLISSSGPITADSVDAEILKRFKLRGKVLADPAVVKLMDNQLRSGHSTVIPAALNKQGELYRGKSLLTAADFTLLRRHVRHLVAETATGILQGRVEISPVSLGRKKACRFCPYKAVCQFDLLLEENHFRLLRSGTEKQVCEWLAQMQLTDDKGRVSVPARQAPVDS
ncbi:MAG: helicase-exonuclease AddAB subunit AddB [Bacillota bacterium]